VSLLGTDLDTKEGQPHSYGRLVGRVVVNEPLGSLAWLTIDVAGWRGARPGQFALLQPQPSRCFLPRALSIADETGERVSFLIAPVGEGTRELGALKPGVAVHVLGPLGNGFDMGPIVAGRGSSPESASALSSGRKRLLIVAGGVGAAPFPFVLHRLADSHLAGRSRVTPMAARADGFSEVIVLLGFRDASQAEGAAPVIEAVSKAQAAGLACRLSIAVEDGSRGPSEKVTDLLARELLPGDQVFACGPPAMSEAVWRICRQAADVQAWFSLEAGMACGSGSCHGCALVLAGGTFARVCVDGPVFSGEQVYGRVAAASGGLVGQGGQA
jgi:dihydroorotate dehydrogenase electron transfer subunit